MKKKAFSFIGKNSIWYIIFLLFLFSCGKSDMVVDDLNSKVTTLDYTTMQIEVSNNIPILAFSTWSDFNNVLSVLVAQTNVYTQNYLSPLLDQGFADESLNYKLTLEGFEPFKPLHIFNKTLGFNSFFQTAILQEKIWLNNSEVLDVNLDPFKNVEVFQSALLNSEGAVMIGSEIFKIDSILPNSTCVLWGNKSEWTDTFIFDGKERKLKKWVGICPGSAQSSTKIYYKTNNGKWSYWFADDVKTDVSGLKRTKLYNGDCGELDSFVNPVASNIKGFYAFIMSRNNNINSAAILNENTVESNHSVGNIVNYSLKF